MAAVYYAAKSPFIIRNYLICVCAIGNTLGSFIFKHTNSIYTSTFCPYLYFGSPIMWVTYLGSWMTTWLGKSSSFGLPRVPFVNRCEFMYLVTSHLFWGQDMGSDCIIFLIIAYLLTWETVIGTIFWAFLFSPEVKERKATIKMWCQS